MIEAAQARRNLGVAVGLLLDAEVITARRAAELLDISIAAVLHGVPRGWADPAFHRRAEDRTP